MAQRDMEWPKDGPNENGMAQDGPKKGEKILKTWNMQGK